MLIQFSAKSFLVHHEAMQVEVLDYSNECYINGIGGHHRYVKDVVDVINSIFAWLDESKSIDEVKSLLEDNGHEVESFE